jgi:hypothetical protein
MIMNIITNVNVAGEELVNRVNLPDNVDLAYYEGAAKCLGRQVTKAVLDAIMENKGLTKADIKYVVADSVGYSAKNELCPPVE